MRNILVVVLVVLAGVAQAQPKQEACKDPRPQVCTQEIQRVCAVTKDQVRHTYSNACMACTNNDVVGYTVGPCI